MISFEHELITVKIACYDYLGQRETDNSNHMITLSGSCTHIKFFADSHSV
jgi:hypothetical protein